MKCILSTNAHKPVSYIGCYTDRIEDRDIYDKDYTNEIRKLATLNIVESCIELCSNDGYFYAAIQS